MIDTMKTHDVVFKNLEGTPDVSLLDQVVALWLDVFPSADFATISTELRQKASLLLTVALQGAKVIGFKVGYAVDAKHFQSWLGGVQEQYRNIGVGNELTKMQHEWCRNKKLQFIRTWTQNESKAMLVLNIKNGFDILGTYVENDGQIKILMQKRLSPH